MSQHEERSNRLIARIRRFVGRETMRHVPKTAYNRSVWKEETREIIEEECLCIGKTCICEEEENANR
jgi:hypothetical protein